MTWRTVIRSSLSLRLDIEYRRGMNSHCYNHIVFSFILRFLLSECI